MLVLVLRRGLRDMGGGLEGMGKVRSRLKPRSNPSFTSPFGIYDEDKRARSTGGSSTGTGTCSGWDEKQEGEEVG